MSIILILFLPALICAELRILTYNIANYDGHDGWEQRAELLADIIADADPHLLALQEVRMNPDEITTHELYVNQAEHLVFLLNKRGKFLGAQIEYQPVMYYPIGNGEEYPLPAARASDHQSHEWEGLAIISRVRIVETGSIFLTKSLVCDDGNLRATQFASIDLSSLTLPTSSLPTSLFSFAPLMLTSSGPIQGGPSDLKQDKFHHNFQPSESSGTTVGATFTEGRGAALSTAGSAVSEPSRTASTSAMALGVSSMDAISSTSEKNENVNLFYLFNSHFGLDGPCLQDNARETHDYIFRRAARSAALLVGDLNAEPNNPALAILSGGNDHSADKLFDLWPYASHHSGYTFPAENPIKRIDYGWANSELASRIGIDLTSPPEKHKSNHLAISLVGTIPSQGGLFPSDHLGLLFRLNISKV